MPGSARLNGYRHLLPAPATALTVALAFGTSLLAPPSVQAQPDMPPDADPLTALLNAYRANPGACNGIPAAPASPLAQEPALAQLRIGAGTIIEAALERSGYHAAQAQAVYVTGPENARAAMNVLEQKYCRVLLSEDFSAAGSHREGTSWTVILARPAPPLPSLTYPDWRDAGREILIASNEARASARDCGTERFPAAPPLTWNPALGDAALAHSRDMATQRYFNHQARDGSQAAERAVRAGYSWRRIGENIAFGQRSPQEAVESWLSSPGHCANLMNRDFTEMGAAYGVTPARHAGIIYWTQVFGTPR